MLYYTSSVCVCVWRASICEKEISRMSPVRCTIGLRISLCSPACARRSPELFDDCLRIIYTHAHKHATHTHTHSSNFGTGVALAFGCAHVCSTVAVLCSVLSCFVCGGGLSVVSGVGASEYRASVDSTSNETVGCGICSVCVRV